MRSGRPHGQTIGRQLARPLAAALVACFASVVAATTPADLLLVQARIYTAAGPKLAQALAVSGGRLVYVGDEGAARAYRGPRIAVVSAHGRLVVPGLVDAHLHPIDMIRLEQCDLRVAAKSLSELTAFVGRCIRRYHPLPGQWLNVMQWNSSAGNQPDAHHPTLRAALDLAAPRNPVQLMAATGTTARLTALRSRLPRTIPDAWSATTARHWPARSPVTHNWSVWTTRASPTAWSIRTRGSR